MHQRSQHVKTGLDVLAKQNFAPLKNKNVALLGHPASVDSNLNHIYDLMIESGVNIVRLFGPEHGFFGSAQDMESVDDSTQSRIPILSLYGQNRKSLMLDPTSLDEVDVLVCDLQDVGSRYYTFIYTLAFALTACSKANVKCIVLDRPNPIGGNIVAGNIVKSDFHSFVGEYPLPIRHGMTIGELARFFKDHDKIDVELEVVWMEGWQRDMYFDDTHLPFVLPSPNMPSVATEIIYPGLCLIEGTNLSEGRGTTRPFELVGAPYINDPKRFAKLASQQLQGAKLRPCWFKPMFQKHAEQMCGGLQIHITDRSKLEPINLGISLIKAAREFQGFSWRTEPYEFVSDRLAIDLLFGDDRVRKLLEVGKDASDVLAFMNKDLESFQPKREKYLHADYESSLS